MTEDKLQTREQMLAALSDPSPQGVTEEQRVREFLDWLRSATDDEITFLGAHIPEDQKARGRRVLEQFAATPAPQGDWVRHKKRGSTYEVLGEGEMQFAIKPGAGVIKEGDKLTVYRGTDGKIWLRWPAEFNDGRFEQLASAPAPVSIAEERPWTPCVWPVGACPHPSVCECDYRARKP